MVAVLLALLVRFTKQSRNAREKVSVSPAPASPIDEKKKVELRPEWLPENTTIVTPALNVDNHVEDDASAAVALPKRKRAPKTVKGKKTPKKVTKPAIDYNHTTDKIQPLIFFQSVTGYTPPRWPDPAFPQQAHLDVLVDDLDASERQAVEIGASLLRGGDACGYWLIPQGIRSA